MPSYYLTGTDTGAGKTFATCALLDAARAAGRTALGMKPVASGCLWTERGWRNEDALALLAHGSSAVDYAQVNPYALPAATAPEIAAALAGTEIELAPILAAHAHLAARADLVFVEGVGGWLAPLSATLDQPALARALGLPVILVVGLRLGCLNHARLSARAILADGFVLAGWIASDVDPAMEYTGEYFEALRRVLPAPLLGRLPHVADRGPGAVAGCVRLPDPGL
ncbi:MAG: dethiobiotin synthase [Arenimonas sp.]